MKIIHSKSIILRNVDPFNIHFQYRFLVITGNSPFSTEIMHTNFDFRFFFSFKDFSLACHRDKCDSKPCGDVNYNPPNGQFGHRQSEADDVFGLFLSIISKFITVPWIGERDSNYILSVKVSGMKVSFAVFETVSIIPMLIYFFFSFRRIFAQIWTKDTISVNRLLLHGHIFDLLWKPVNDLITFI